ncbi:MAG TPA: HEPN domain-containing protein [Candidatus Nanoarchaeia archaeon]|nr:HEPN domain-containing protein [Candidatus Nanoarchaeia archaeon]
MAASNSTEQEALLWMRKAKEDRDTSIYNFQGKRLEAAIFYAQQAAEKSLKALLLMKEGAYPRIHDLTKLSKQLNAPETILRHCAMINPAYTSTRYPDEEGKFSEKDCRIYWMHQRRFWNGQAKK